MDRKLKTIGYVMIPRDLLLKAFDEHPEAGGDMDAFLRILTYVNYAEAVVKRESREVLCARGESVISYSQWAEILGWSLGRTRRCFIRLITNGSIELVKGDCASHIRIPAYDVWTGKRKNGTAADSTVEESFGLFWNEYHETTSYASPKSGGSTQGVETIITEGEKDGPGKYRRLFLPLTGYEVLPAGGEISGRQDVSG